MENDGDMGIRIIREISYLLIMMFNDFDGQAHILIWGLLKGQGHSRLVALNRYVDLVGQRSRSQQISHNRYIERELVGERSRSLQTSYSK